MTDAPKRQLQESPESCDVLVKHKKLCTKVTLSKDSSGYGVDIALSKTDESHENEPEYIVMRATEDEVGITEYISDYPGFSAVMKERYSDFLVNEIDLEGNVVRLTDMEKPADPETNIQIGDMVDKETVDELHFLVDDNQKKEVLIKVTDKDKNLRKTIHEAIRKCFHGLESSTCEKDGEKYIMVKRIDKKSKGRRFQPTGPGNYMHFVLYKENRDTMDAVNTICSYLRIHSKAFSYAGTKDKRGKTSQLVSVYRLPVEKLLTINKKFNMIKVGNIVYKNEQIKLGDLLGNKFIVILRQLKGEPELIEKAIKSLSSRGFLNYFGMQRFGTSSVSTHTIGRSLLQSDWKNAVNLILKPRVEGDENMARSRKIWTDTHDAKRAYENLRNKSSIEGKLFGGLAGNNENDLVNALNAIPRNTRLMYIHSYQSFIWNRVLSKRIQKFGLNVLVGDLIPRDLEEKRSELDTLASNKKSHVTDVEFVTDENIQKVSINDILLPLPGHSVIYPENEIKDFYETFLEEDNMNWGSFESKVRTYSLSGDYRKIIIIPTDVKWEIASYDDVSKPLAHSDLDILQGVPADTESTGGTLQALKLGLKLPSSSYATMAIREVLKCSTSYQAK